MDADLSRHGSGAGSGACPQLSGSLLVFSDVEQ
jgi:hypothetical protein